MPFQNVPVRVPFSKSTVFKICGFQNQPFSKSAGQNVPFSCERKAYQRGGGVHNMLRVRVCAARTLKLIPMPIPTNRWVLGPKIL